MAAIYNTGEMELNGKLHYFTVSPHSSPLSLLGGLSLHYCIFACCMCVLLAKYIIDQSVIPGCVVLEYRWPYIHHIILQSVCMDNTFTPHENITVNICISEHFTQLCTCPCMQHMGCGNIQCAFTYTHLLWYYTVCILYIHLLGHSALPFAAARLQQALSSKTFPCCLMGGWLGIVVDLTTRHSVDQSADCFSLQC